MKKEDLLLKLTGTKTPRHITKREDLIIQVCLGIINRLEDEIQRKGSPTYSIASQSTKETDDYEFNMHRRWKDNDEQTGNSDEHTGTIRHFQD